MVEEVRIPQFCGQCGTHLVEDRLASVAGYDVYTGSALTNEYVTRRCPNPTIRVTSGIRPKTTTTYHPQYAFLDGTWGQG